MGQALSFHDLQECVRRDFSDRVLVSHGLFRSPHPLGTHFKCEVDLDEMVTPTEWKGNETGLVVQAIKAFDDSCMRTGEDSNGDWDAKHLEAFDVADASKNFDMDFPESSLHNGSQSQSFDYVVSKLISRLASHISIEAASFDAIISMLHRLHNANREDNVPGLVCHPSYTGDCNSEIDKQSNVRNANLVPLLGAFKGDKVLYLFYPQVPFTLESILHFSPAVLDDDWSIRFLVYQLLSGIAFFHGCGIVHGDLKPSNVLLTNTLWCWITGFHVESSERKRQKLVTPSLFSLAPTSFENVVAEELYLHPDFGNWQSAFKLWWQGELSNFDYLLILNRLAGRRWGDRGFHTVMPWVIDFSVRPDDMSDTGWRDLTKSKWRLAKGDEQLDFTYATAEIPHHVSDECLSELAVCIYKARRLPLFVLRQTVRSVYEPNEYPVSLKRLYQWTPDECIPEFYSEASVFSSIHARMSDLSVPPWAQNPDDFIQLHRAALEGEHVSQQLHHWIDLTFGYQLSGEAAVTAKNVTLSAATLAVPRSQGRRQLFSLPHPRRENSSLHFKGKGQDASPAGTSSIHEVFMKATLTTTTQTGGIGIPGLKPAAPSSILSLESLEQAALFCESARHLSPKYRLVSGSVEDSLNVVERNEHSGQLSSISTIDLPSRKESDQMNFKGLLEAFAVEGTDEGRYQDFLLWKSREAKSTVLPEGASDDIFAVGCMIAEIYLRRPLFDPVSIKDFEIDGEEPDLLQQLPVHIQSLVRAMIDKNPQRRLSASGLLESPFFPPTVRAVHSFLSVLHLLESKGGRLEFVAKLANQRAFLLMGPLAARKCISSCLLLLVLPCECNHVQAWMDFLRASLVALKPHDINALLVPTIQTLLQGHGNAELKVAVLQTSFVRDLFKAIGTTLYLHHIHHSVLATLQQSSEKGPSAAAASVLIETCQELGVPITCNQTILPLLQQFGRDITIFGIDTVVGIGKQLGELMVVKHIIPSLRALVLSCLHFSSTMENSGPAQSWRMLAMGDAVIVMQRLLHTLSPSTVLAELVQEPHNVFTKLLLHTSVNGALLQSTAEALLSICKFIGPDSTASYVLPHLRQLFDGVAFDAMVEGKDDTNSKGVASLGSLARLEGSSHEFLKDEISKSSADCHIGDLPVASGDVFKIEDKTDVQMALTYSLYSGLASLLGIERLRQSLTTWLILEQLLLKHFNWKWEDRGATYPRSSEKAARATKASSVSTCEFSPSSLLLNEIGWSIPQPSSIKSKLSTGEEGSKQFKVGSEAGLRDNYGPWMWVPSSGEGWEGAEYLTRPGLGFGIGKDERPWRLKAAIAHSWHAHPGSIKAVAVGDGERTVFTAGFGAKMKGLVKQWKLSTTQCVMDYTGHEEAVNDICVIPWTGRVASCDGTIHLWSKRTGEHIASFCESIGTAIATTQGENSRALNIGIIGTSLSSGMLYTGLHGSLYTCMHLLQTEEKLVAGTGNGHLRFIDLPSGRYLHSWQCDAFEPSGSPLVSAIASSGNVSLPWVAMGFSSGHCRLLDLRAGSMVACWRAHEGFITKLVAFEDHFLISSSLDKTLVLWDIRRTVPAQLQVFQGHSHGISSFALWSNNLLSAGGNKIGLSTVSHSPPQERQTVKCHKLYSSEISSLSLSSITAIGVLPFSRLFLVGTDDGSLRVCR